MFSKEVQALAVRMYIRTKSFRKLAKLTEIPRSTLHRWVTRNPLVARQRRAKKLSSHAVEVIRQHLDTNPFTTLKDLRDLVARYCSNHVAVRTISRCVRRMDYTRKRTHRVVEKDGLEEKRAEFRLKLKNISPDDVISIDESAFYFDMKPVLGYARKGSRLKSVVHSHRQSKWTLLMAVSNEQVVGYELFKGSCNSAKFIEFMNNLDTAGRRYMMMDNVAFHKTKTVAAALATKGIEALFLPPYSPEFQPIECVFSMIKGQYRRLPCAVDTGDALEDDGGYDGHVFMRVMYSINCVENQALCNTFLHCWKA